RAPRPAPEARSRPPRAAAEEKPRPPRPAADARPRPQPAEDAPESGEDGWNGPVPSFLGKSLG
ncbi:MAG: hypothetical protein JWO81_654, partial [Alphaproteobacteria bacterium]|nr:hypothetical protein [Alphaproteobacteria bacterium]